MKVKSLKFNEWFVKENRQDQYNQAAMALMALQYSGKADILKGKDDEILSVLQQLGKMPKHTSPRLFLSQLKMVANGSFNPNQDLTSGSEYIQPEKRPQKS